MNLSIKLLTPVLLLLLNLTPALAEHGGITGGGGGTTNPNPVGRDLARRMVFESRFFLQAYLNDREFWWFDVIKANGHEDRELQFLFDRPDDVFQYLAKAEIELSPDKACRDGDGKEVDGSIHAHRAGAICISTFTLGTKLSELNYEFEIAALILHEIVHQMGGNEEMAMAIQRSAVFGLYKIDLSDTQISYELLRKRLGETRFRIDMLANAALSPQPLYSHYEGVSNELLQFRDGFIGSKVHPLRSDSRRESDGQLLKFSIVADYTCSIDSHSDEQWRKFCRDRYVKGFGETKEISLTDYFTARAGFPDTRR